MSNGSTNADIPILYKVQPSKTSEAVRWYQTEQTCSAWDYRSLCPIQSPSSLSNPLPRPLWDLRGLGDMLAFCLPLMAAVQIVNRLTAALPFSPAADKAEPYQCRHVAFIF